MPFTLAHPAAAVPLARPLGRHGVLSALVIGSMTPDIWYLVPFAVSRNQSHDLPGLFLVCLPLGCALYLVYHLLLKHPVAALLPVPISSRLCHYLEQRPVLPRSPWTGVMLSVLAGAATHVLWDAFTHSHGRVGRTVPLLTTHLFSVAGSEITLATVLQYGSGAAGLALLAWWSWRWLCRAPARPSACMDRLTPRARVSVTAGLLGLGLVAAAAGALPAALGTRNPEYSLVQAYLRPAFSAGLQAFAAGLLAYSAVWQMWAQRSRRTTQN
jgi:hypothetical protein